MCEVYAGKMTSVVPVLPFAPILVLPSPCPFSSIAEDIKEAKVSDEADKATALDREKVNCCSTVLAVETCCYEDALFLDHAQD